MILSQEQKHRANAIYFFLKHKEDEYFKNTSIRKCMSCNGSGLIFNMNIDGTRNWDAQSYCSKCEGTGFTGLLGYYQIDEINYVCKNCGGSGCSKCFGGITDWISYVMGG